MSETEYRCWRASDVKWITETPKKTWLLCGACKRQGVQFCYDPDCDLSLKSGETKE